MGTRRTDAEGAKAPAGAEPEADRRPQAAAERPEARPGGGRPDDDDGKAAAAPPDYRQLFKQLIARANQGERLAIDRLKQFLDANPHLWEKAGDLTAIAERCWIELIAGPEVFTFEAVKRRLAATKEQLKGPQPAALEALLVDLIGVAWLGTQHAEIQASSPAGGSLAQAAFKLKRAESSQKRLLAATKTLANLRALVPQGLVPAQPVRLYDPDQQSG